MGYVATSSSEAFGDLLVDFANNNILGTSDTENINSGSIYKQLAFNGGPTQTHALLRGSPARNVAKVDLYPERDQRGKSRDKSFLLPIIAASKKIGVVDLGGNCDIGAVEFTGGD